MKFKKLLWMRIENIVRALSVCYLKFAEITTIYLEKGSVLMAKLKFAEFVKKYMKYNQKRR